MAYNYTMDIITGIMLIGLVASFIGAIMVSRMEFCVLSILFTFCSFVAVVKDVSIPSDLVMLIYIPIIAMGMFSIASFFRIKVL